MANECDAKHVTSAPQPKQIKLHAIITNYDKTYHCMLVAMRCAVHNQAFLSVEDHYYQLEIEHLQHGVLSLHYSLPLP